MMPDRYDEIRKRKMLEDSQVMDLEPLDMPYDLPALATEPEVEPTRKPASEGMDGQSAMYLGDAVASAGPALLSLFGGGSPAVVSSLFDKGNQYAQKRGAQEEITKANTSVIDRDGQPLNIRSRDAIGEKPYYQTKLGLGMGANGVRQFQPLTLKNVKTNEIVVARQNANGYFDAEGVPYDMKTWLPFKTEDLIREKTVQGGSSVTARDKYTGKLNKVTSKAGIGDVMGGVSKEEAVSGIKSAEKAKEKSYKQLEAIEGARRSITILDKPNLTPEEAASGIFAIIKANNGERLSDSDYAMARGTEFKSLLRQFEDWSDGKILGQINPKIIQAYKEVAKSTIEAKQRELRGTKSHFVPDAMLPAQGQKKLDTIIGGANAKSNDKMDDVKQELLKQIQSKFR